MMAPNPILRFAPSPNGRLHLGHAFSALFTARAAAALGGTMRLRLEDIDPVRSKPEFDAAIIEDLLWLGLHWPEPVLRQSTRFAAYGEAADRLRHRGLLYPCFCTRRKILAEVEAAGHAPHGPDGPLYPGTCRALPSAEREARIAAGTPYALRLDAAKAAALAGPLSWTEIGTGTIPVDPTALGDVVLARKDVPASYHLAVTIDDELQGVTLVTRGRDLLHATHLHRLLQALLDLRPPTYRHHRLLANDKGQRLAKRDGAVTLRALRAAGRTPAEVRAMAGYSDAESETCLGRD
jgi:glutamyl-Q tRNA(Asp) synthetase